MSRRWRCLQFRHQWGPTTRQFLSQKR
ncbi:hypothetical protein A2U01_0053218, partial [Trifolium medium]|nr:hypothetical protein [Trifolium medium]